MMAFLGALLFAVAMLAAVATIVAMIRSHGNRMIAALMMTDPAPVRTPHRAYRLRPHRTRPVASASPVPVRCAA